MPSKEIIAITITIKLRKTGLERGTELSLNCFQEQLLQRGILEPRGPVITERRSWVTHRAPEIPITVLSMTLRRAGIVVVPHARTCSLLYPALRNALWSPKTESIAPSLRFHVPLRPLRPCSVDPASNRGTKGGPERNATSEPLHTDDDKRIFIMSTSFSASAIMSVLRARYSSIVSRGTKRTGFILGPGAQRAPCARLAPFFPPRTP